METRYKSKQDDSNSTVISAGRCKFALNRNDIIKRLENLTGTKMKSPSQNLVLTYV